MPREALSLLWDIVDSAEEVAKYIAGVDRDEFLGDRMRQAAIAYPLMIAGEALTRLSRDAPETAARIPERGQAIGLRNYLAHEYDSIDLMTVWDTAVRDLPELRQTAGKLLSELESAAAAASVEAEEK